MSNTTDPSLSEAQELVGRIAKSYGWLADSVREVTPPDALTAIANLQTVLGAAARTLATDLYQSKARFVFELIQNAEDNNYKRAATSNAEPYIQFSIYPNKIVVENNEDGFTVANVESICKVATSSKTRTDSQYYIGEKGIGFKSVFMVASKVYIHSGPFSFFFEHPSRSDASGMGMITPVYYLPDEPLNHARTRITLILRDAVDGKELEKQFFDDLADTLLLFLKKLKRISVNKYSTTTTLSRHTTYTCDCDDSNRRATLTKVTQAGGSPPETRLKRYFTTKRRVSNLPDDDDRRGYNTAEIILAFPVDGNNVPVIEQQEVYAYLPIGSFGFPFLVQSDFITQASRQDILECPRNYAIFDGIATAFVDAILQFCKHPTLQYQWMRFSPVSFQSNSLAWDISPKIKELLGVTPVLRPYNHGDLKLISELRIVPKEFKDVLGAPLFADSPKGTYLANEYQKGNDTSTLMSLGLRALELADVIERVQQDLASPFSNLKAKTTPNDWHLRASKYLLQSFNGQCIPQLKKLKLIPLENGDFTSVLEGPVYFPQSDGMPIPTDIGLRLVKPGTFEDNKWRKGLVSAIGVTEASTEVVRKLIFEKYESKNSRRKITLSRSVAHLRYLYWTHGLTKPIQAGDNFSALATKGGFGASTASAQTASSGSLFGSGSNDRPTSTGFGSTNTTKPTSPFGSSSTGFGSPVNPFGSSNDRSTSTGFGSTNTTKSTSLFGSSSTGFGSPVNPFGAFGSSANPFGSSLCDTSSSTNPPKPASTFNDFLFNSPNSKDTPSPTIAFGGSAFGSSSSPKTLKPAFSFGTATPSSGSSTTTNFYGSSPFGTSTPTNDTKPSSLFGATSSSSPELGSISTPSFGGSLFGGSSSANTPKPSPLLGRLTSSSTPSSEFGSPPSIPNVHSSSTSRSKDKKVPFSEIKPSSDPFESTSIPEDQQLATTGQILAAPGTREASFQPFIEDEPNTRASQQNAFQSICFQKQYQMFSYEELRLADCPQGDKSGYHDLWVFDQGRLVPCTGEVYFASEGEFSVQELLKSSTDGSYPGLSVSLLNSSYFASAPKINTPWSPTWESWLQNQLGILRQPRLADSNNPAKLSNIFSYLAKYRPDNFLGALKTYWSSYKWIITPGITETISAIKVPCINGTNIQIQAAILPHLESCARKFLRGDEKLPFLSLRPQSSTEEWMFLTRFRVRADEDLEFYLALLEYIRNRNNDAENLSSPERLFQLYETIYNKYKSSENRVVDQERICSFFKSKLALYAPDCIKKANVWTMPLSCAWDGPPNFLCRKILVDEKEYRDNPILTKFLRETLRIPDLGWEALMEELTWKKSFDPYDQTAIIDIYQRLEQCQPHMDEGTRNSIWDEFRTSKLIFALPKGWHSTEECIWYDRAQIEDRVAISSLYPSLREFFVEFLGVQVPDLRMLVKELKKVSTSTRSVEKAKSLIWQINSMEPSAKDLASIQKSAIFPVKIGNDGAHLQSKEKDFVIVDREKLANAFRGPDVTGTLAILDFTNIEEVRKLQPFLVGMNVEERYMSNMVNEITSFAGHANDSIDHDDILTRHIRRRAYALARCAFHFRSPSIQDDNRSLYQKLLNAQIFKTDEIATKLELTQNGMKIQATLDKSTLHIKEDQFKLKIYVPKDPKDRELCYRRLLPPRLLAQREDDGTTTTHPNPQATGVISDIINCSDLIVEDILEDAGIVRVSFPDEYGPHIVPDTPSSPHKPREYASASVSSEESRTQVGSPAPEDGWTAFISGRHSCNLSPPPHIAQRFGLRAQSAEPPITPVALPRPNLFSATDHVAPSLFSVNNCPADYHRLLGHVIEAAKGKRGGFPSGGAFDFHDLLSALPVHPSEDTPNYDLPFGVRSENQLAHDMRVGAAGELYAFEILKCLDPALPGFGRGYPKTRNWESTIRKYVTAHENYKDLEPWKGVETADITYNDAKGNFTKLLIENGYLDGGVWANATPKYFLEVKASTKDCSTRFFLSKSQYQRMHRMKLKDSEPSTEVYIIIRVFNLDKDSIDMRVYVDPAGMQGKELEFTPESYSVVPSSSSEA